MTAFCDNAAHGALWRSFATPIVQSMIWNIEVECLPRLDLVRLQLERLGKLLVRLDHRVPFYRDRFHGRAIALDSIKGLADLRELPFTRKSDLLAHYPFGLLATPLNEVARIHASSGTTGKPTVVAYTRADLDMWAEVCARC